MYWYNHLIKGGLYMEETKKLKLYQKWWFWVIIATIIILVISIIPINILGRT